MEHGYDKILKTGEKDWKVRHENVCPIQESNRVSFFPLSLPLDLQSVDGHTFFAHKDRTSVKSDFEIESHIKLILWIGDYFVIFAIAELRMTVNPWNPPADTAVSICFGDLPASHVTMTGQFLTGRINMAKYHSMSDLLIYRLGIIAKKLPQKANWNTGW